MVICLKAYKKLNAGDRYVPFDGKVLMKWPNDYDFGFNIFNPSNWKPYLERFEFGSGERLPRRTKHRIPLVYHVYVFGRSKGMPIAKPRSSIYSLYPGYDKNLRPIPIITGDLSP